MSDYHYKTTAYKSFPEKESSLFMFIQCVLIFTRFHFNVFDKNVSCKNCVTTIQIKWI